MTKEIALHCMKSASELERELCEECPLYGQTGRDHCYEDALQYVIEMLEQDPCDMYGRKVLREIETETNRLQVGDRIKVNYSGEEHYATAIEERGDIMLFLTDDYLDDAMPMNKDDTTEGGWEESFLREKLQDLAENTDIKDQLVPFENGDLLTLLSIQEMCGLDENFDLYDDQIEWLKDRRHRIAERKDVLREWGWLRSVASAGLFACVDRDGFADDFYPSTAIGVRPAFAIKILGGLKVADEEVEE